MNDEKFDGAIGYIKSCLAIEKNVVCTLLFGSVARGQAGKDSDIDICIVLSDGGKNAVSEKILDIEKKSNININVVFTDPKFTGLDRYFIETLLREAIVITGKMPDVPIQQLLLEPYEIIKYDLSTLAQTDKMKVRRLLYGLTTKKKANGKMYENKKSGMVAEIKALRIGIASILIPERETIKVERLLREYKVKFRKITIWLSKP